MGKLKKKIPRFVQEIIVTAISYAGLWALWNFVIKEPTFSDQALSMIGLALSTAAGVLTAIVVSFVLITWQSSRRERSTAFWHWRNALDKLEDSFDANLELLKEIAQDVIRLTWESSKVALVAPMPRDQFIELSSKVSDKLTQLVKELQGIKTPSKEQETKGRAYKDIMNQLVYLATANFEHRLAHFLYNPVLSLRGLLYRLLGILTASILVVAISNTITLKEVSDIYNAPLAIVLIGWFVYVLIYLGREIKRISRLEDEFRRQAAK